jgi:hypothetical protein
LAVFKRTTPRPPIHRRDRLFWLLLSHAWEDWRTALIIESPRQLSTARLTLNHLRQLGTAARKGRAPVVRLLRRPRSEVRPPNLARTVCARRRKRGDDTRTTWGLRRSPRTPVTSDQLSAGTGASADRHARRWANQPDRISSRPRRRAISRSPTGAAP